MSQGEAAGRNYAAMIANLESDKVKTEFERKKKEEEEDKKRQQDYIREQKEKEAEAERQRLASLTDKGRELAPEYRDSYEVGEITSFEEAKQAADETYLQSWYDRANKISSKWTDKDYALIAEPQYEEYKDGPRHTKTRRVVPEGYDEYVEAQERINAGPLDFSNEETHLELIKPPQVRHRGYGKRQYWIDENDPLRQAVEAQADVMQGFLDAEGISIVQEYPESFDRPDSFRGEGVYLNTGTGAHIDWDAGLKRMQRYQTSPDAELGTYSNVFVRPDPEGIAKPLAFVGAVTGNPWLSGASAVAAGGDLEDALKGAAKGYVIGKVTAPILENIVTPLGIDKDLFGMDAETFSESTMDVQTAILEGKDIEEALLKEFGVPAVKQIAGAVGDMLPNIDLPESQLLSDIGDALEPIVGAVREAGSAFDDAVLQKAKPIVKAVGDVGQEVIDITAETFEPVVDLADEGLDVFGEKVVDPVLQAGSDVLSEVEDVVIDPIKEVAPVVEDIFIDPIKEVAPVVEDVVKESGRKFDDAVLQPIKENVLEPIVDAGQEVIDIVQEGGRQFDDAVLQPVKDFVEDIELPEAPDFPDLPDLPDLPDFPDLPDLPMPDLPFSIGGLLDSGMPQQRTTTPVENLFDKELFKFDTEIKSTQQMLSPIMNLRRYG
jgi:hypothetical protein